MENKYKIVLGGLMLWFFSVSGEAQAQTTGLKLGSNPGTKDPNAILDLSGTTTQGVLLPRVALTGTANSAPLAGTVTSGMLVYNTTTAGDVTPGVYFANGSQWVRVASNGSGGMIQAPSLALTSTTDPTGTTGQVLYNTNASAGVPIGLVVWNGSEWVTAGGTVTGAANGISLLSGNVELGGALTKQTTVGLGTNALTLDATGTGKLIVDGPAGNTSGLRLANLTGTGSAGVAGQKVLSVNATGDIVLATDFGSNNAGTVTNVTGTAPINISTGNTTPVISIDALGITNGLIAADAVTGDKIANGTITNTDLSSGTGGIYSGNGDLGNDGSITVGNAKVLNFVYNGFLAQHKFSNIANNGRTITTFSSGTSPDEKLFEIRTHGKDYSEPMMSNTLTSTALLASLGAKIILGTRSSDDLIFGTSNTERMRIVPGGNVGIGTISPTTRLDIDGQIRIRQGAPGAGKVLTSDADGLATWTTPSVGTGSVTSTSIEDASIVNADLATGVGGIYKGSGSLSGATTVTQGANTLDFTGDGNLIKTGAGNVGIGTTNPADKLTVRGGAVSLIPTSGNSTTGYAPLLLKNIAENNVFKIQQEFNTDDGKIFFLTDNADNGATESIRMVIQRSNGNVGIGTTTPQAKLDIPNGILVTDWNLDATVAGTVANLTPLAANARGLIIGRNRSGGINEVNFLSASGAFSGGFSFLNLLTNGTTQNLMTINGNGNVGIGSTTTPTSRLQVAGSFATAINNSATNITLNDTHTTLTIDLTSGNATITLPAANSCSGRIYHIVRTDGTTNVLTFSAAISLGNTTFTTSNIPGATFIIQSDGTNWRLINN